MHVVMRSYADSEVADMLLRHKADVEKLIRSAPGFVSYVIAKFPGSTMTATICETEAGCQRSVELAKEWLVKNAPSVNVNNLEVKQGEILLRLT